ncbi:MAG: hypothetical protein IAE78_10570 [Myxococcus sp.]|nr:hypothetical protein [Myxococcus sp.]
MRAGLVLLLTLAGCRCRERQAVTATPPKVAHAQTRWARHEVAAVPEDVYGVPAWSRVFALAFERPVSIGVPACHVADAGCLGVEPTAMRAEPMVGLPTVLGRDEPLAFIGEQVTFLEEDRRRAALTHALSEALQIDPASAPLAAVLFQNDLWERADAVSAAIRTEPQADWAALEDLRSRFVAVMRHVALSKAQLAALGSNDAAVEQRYPELLAGFAKRDGWVELRARSTEHQGATVWNTTTRHAERHGHRMVFRVFIHHQKGRAALEVALARWPEPLPAGTRFVITGAPMALTREGTLEAAPFITLVETRLAMPEGFAPGSVGALAHDVLEGTRAELTRAFAQTGGLRLLGRDALLPVGATCMPDFTSRLPSAATCLMCHGPTGARVTGPMAHGEVKFELTDDGAAAGRAVADAKRASASFQTLGW